MKNSKWLEVEQWFMRGIGAALLLLAVLGGYFGTLSNPNNDTMVQGMNIVLALIMAAAGAWALWWSISSERIAKMFEGIKEQGAGISRLLGVVQLVIAALFLLEGTSRGGIVMLLLGAMMLISAGFFFWRGQQIST
jgi:hypothetical protein